MAIIDIERSKVEGSKGMERTIDKSAEKLILDTIQITQYMYPEASTVRELTSNAVDSVVEKRKAIEILTGKKKIEDYFITRNDEKYKDSNFDPTYYNLAHLDSNDTVSLNYYEGEGMGWCDKLVIKDPGVGLGDDRLFGICRIGYSSKRNNTSMLGGFGFGAKVSLSLRNDYYDMETVHNGRLFKLRLFSYKIDCMIPKFDAQGNTNDFIEQNGVKFYYEKTDSKNYTEITVPTKKIHRDKIRQAVKSQLLYFDNVTFTVHRENGSVDDIDVKANILYNSDNIIISENYEYSKPHLVLVKPDDRTGVNCVSYGYINFRELELENMYGNIAIKVPARSVIRHDDGTEEVICDGVELLPSREAVVWSEHTRNYVLKIFQNVVDEATKEVEKQLKTEDFIDWLEKCQKVLNYQDSKSILSRMTSVIDKDKIKPKFKGDKDLNYGLSLFDNIEIKKVYTSKKYINSVNKIEVNRDNIDSLYQFNPTNVYIKDEETNRAKDIYISETIGSATYISWEDDETIRNKYATKVKEVLDENGQPTNLRVYTDEQIDKWLVKRAKVIKYLQSSDRIKKYSDVVVPEEWLKNFTQVDQKVEEEVKQASLSPQELRKLQERTVCNTFNFLNYEQRFQRSKQEPQIQEIINDAGKIVYGFGEDEPLLHIYSAMAHGSFGDYSLSNINFYQSDKKCIMVSQANKKYYTNHTHVTKAFKNITEDFKLTMDEYLIKWYTAKKINDVLDKISWISKYKEINSEIHTLYEELYMYQSKYYYNLNDRSFIKQDLFNDFISHFDKCFDIQIYCQEHSSDNVGISQKSKELFGSDIIKGAHVVDPVIIAKLDALLVYTEPVWELFNKFIDFDFNEYPQGRQLIQDILVFKNLHDYSLPNFNNLNETNNQEAEAESTIEATA